MYSFHTIYTKVHLPSTSNKMIIIPFGDVHRDTKSCDVDRWKHFLSYSKKILKKNKNTFFIGCGDYNDFASRSEVQKIASSKLHETTYAKFDEIAMKHVQELCREISFMKGNLLGLLGGNHEWRFQNGKTATEEMCERLCCKFLGWVAYIRMGITINDLKRNTLDIVVCHGRAGGKLVGTSFNQVDDMRQVFPNADIYIQGHDHKKGALPTTTINFETVGMEIKPKQRRQWICRSGSFLRGYIDGMESYIVKNVSRALDLGTIRIECEFHSNKGFINKDIHVWS